ncbi:MAG: glycosyltransferase family 39 protein, partial [Edaphobacter sp.]
MTHEPSFLRISRPALLLLLLIIVCGTALRIAYISHEALEGDEIFSRRVVLLSPPNEIAAIRNDLVHPPLYYFLLQATTRIWGSSPNGIRGYSLLCGIASIGLIALVGGTLPDGRFVGLLAAALLALNQTYIFYSQEARSYASYSLLVLLLVLWVARVTRLSGNQPSFRHWVLGTLLMTMLVYTHYVGAIYVGFAVLAILLSHIPRTRRIASFVCAAIAALCFVPWLIAIEGVYNQKHGLGANLDWEGHPTIYSLKQVFASALGLLEVRGG